MRATCIVCLNKVGKGLLRRKKILTSYCIPVKIVAMLVIRKGSDHEAARNASLTVLTQSDWANTPNQGVQRRKHSWRPLNVWSLASLCLVIGLVLWW